MHSYLQCAELSRRINFRFFIAFILAASRLKFALDGHLAGTLTKVGRVHRMCTFGMDDRLPAILFS